MRHVWKSNLDDTIQFDEPFTLSPTEGAEVPCAAFRDSLDYPAGYDLGHAPDVYVDGVVDEHGDVHVSGLPQMDGTGWAFYSVGYSQQTGQLRKDPTMHASEALGGRLARDMITEGGTYVVTEVPIVTGDQDGDGSPASGWVVLRKDDE